MAQQTGAAWQPEGDTYLGQRLTVHLLWRARYWLLAGLLGGALLFGVVTLFLPPSYSADAQIIYDQPTGERGAEMPAGMPFLGQLRGADIINQFFVLKSRELALAAIHELGLNVEVVDPAAPDAPMVRLKAKLGYPPDIQFTRVEHYTRLQVHAVSVHPEVLDSEVVWLSGTPDGGWMVEDLSGASGEPVELPYLVKFTPVLGPAHRPEYRYKLIVKSDAKALKDFRKRLIVTLPQENAGVIQFSFRHYNPVVCKQVIETVVAHYLTRYRQQKLGDIDVMLQYIAAEIANATRLMEETQAALRAYREEHQAYEPTAQGRAAIGAISQLSLSRSSNQIQLMQISGVLDSLASRTPEEIYDSIQAPATPLPLEQALVERLASLIRGLNQARQTKTDAHPEIQGILAEIDVVLSQIEDSLRTSFGQLEVANRELAAEIARQQGLLSELPAAEGQIALLTSELEAQDQILQMLKLNEAETKVRRANTQLEARLLDAPMLPAKRDSPSVRKNAMLGGAVGVLLAFLVVLLLAQEDRRFRSLRELRLDLGVGVLGVLPGHPLRRRWTPVDTHRDACASLAKLLGCKGHALAIVHQLGAAGGFDLAWGIAGALGQPERPALLIDADGLNSALCNALDRAPIPGLAEVAQGRVELQQAAVALDELRHLLGPGEGAPSHEDCVALLPRLLDHYATVLVCLPPPRQWTEDPPLLAHLKGAVLSVPLRGCTPEELADTAEQLARRGAALRGAIVTHYASRRDVVGRGELRFVAVASDE